MLNKIIIFYFVEFEILYLQPILNFKHDYRKHRKNGPSK